MNRQITLKDIKELYPDKDRTYFSIYDYHPILNSFGNILLEVTDSDYQGDTRLLYESNGEYGYLIFRWGSCSGCDALQSCRNYNDVLDLTKQLQNDIKWFDTLDLLKHYFKNKDWGLDWSWHSNKTKEFVQKVIDYIPDANETT